MIFHHCLLLLACYHELTTWNRSVSSPGYPNNYPNALDCKYLLKYPSVPGFKVKVFFKSFDLELETNCKFDSVTIYDGKATSATKLGNENGYCGSNMPPSFISSGNEMLIVFKADISGTRKGFEFTFVRSE